MLSSFLVKSWGKYDSFARGPMDTEQSVTPTRPGTPGLDVFKIASRSISGFLHSFKTGENRQVRMPYTSTLELKLALYLEYHPHVSTYQRGDASPACAKAYSLVAPLGTPYRINYLCGFVAESAQAIKRA